MRAAALIFACIFGSTAAAGDPMPPVIPPAPPGMAQPVISAPPIPGSVPAAKFPVHYATCDGCNAAAAPVPSPAGDKRGPVLRGINKVLHPKFLYDPDYQVTGADQPLGCSNLKTELQFIFGSCKSFNGTGISAAGCYHNSVVP